MINCDLDLERRMSRPIYLDPHIFGEDRGGMFVMCCISVPTVL